MQREALILYKPAGNKLDNIRIDQGRYPKKLFIKKSDELKAIRAVQSGLHQQLKSDLKTNSHAKVKKILLKSVEEAFSRPISASLLELPAIVNTIVSECEKDSNLARNLILMPYYEYNLFLHSVNVMAQAIDFSFKEQL